ncbi:MAG: DUF1127 domain-containing protein [Rubrivivax sp.]
MPAIPHRLNTPFLTTLRRVVDDSARRIGRDLLAARERWLQRRRARDLEQLMQGLDDRTLRDLGLARSELPSVAHDPLDATRARNRQSA